MKVIIVIPARKGSLRLPNKNRKKLLGKPLIEWTIDFAKKLKYHDIKYEIITKARYEEKGRPKKDKIPEPLNI